jgi:hypothetical protein
MTSCSFLIHLCNDGLLLEDDRSDPIGTISRCIKHYVGDMRLQHHLWKENRIKAAVYISVLSYLLLMICVYMCVCVCVRRRYY